MNTGAPQLRIQDDTGERVVQAAELPLAIGSPGSADIVLPGLSASAGQRPLAMLGLSGERFFVQPSPAGGGDQVAFNGQALLEPQWLGDGDRISVGAQVLRYAKGVGTAAPSLTLMPQPGAGNVTLPPEEDEVPAALTSAAAIAGPSGEAASDVIEATAFSRSSAAVAPGRRRLVPVLGTVVGVLLVGVLWFLFTARAVEVQVSPPAEQLVATGGAFKLKLGQRWLFRPGEYTLTATREGYRPSTRDIVVTNDENQRFAMRLARLPGLLRIATTPASDVLVTIDDELRGKTPLEELEVAAGPHRVELSLPRHVTYRATIEVDGGGKVQDLAAELLADWAELSFTSTPSGATVMLGDKALGITPLTAQIDSGRQTLALRLPGHKQTEVEVTVLPGQAQTVPDVVLRKADGLVSLASKPAGATVTVNGKFRGQTPVQLELTPGKTYKVGFSKAGYVKVNRSVSVVSGQDKNLSVSLQANVGKIRMSITPASAQVYLNGKLHGSGDQDFDLPAVPHKLQVKAAGYTTRDMTITPRPGLPQNLQVALLTEAQTKSSAVQVKPKSPAGQTMIFVDAVGQFDMGASRREQGRRANESQYKVELTRAFYVAETEVTNRQYRQFKRAHDSGVLQRYTLNGDDQPVVGVSWQDAAAYCNWLSERESLAPAYKEREEKLEPVSPMTNGYRLPTEVEWAWIARHASTDPRRFIWGDAMPPPPGAGNFADVSARSIAGDRISGYDDGFAGSAPARSFAPNALGFYDLGGNVSEWIHDFYSIPVSSNVLVDPSGPVSGHQHVVRGASYQHGARARLRLTYRDYSSVGRKDLGFRVARYLE